ncbi:MAG: histone deacetylase [Planctomycetes bacterium]|nr:histone deacetylase [Planctomycetota bacterium]
MRIFATDSFPIPLPAGHFFPLAKYERLRRRVEALGLPAGGRCEIAPAAGDDELRRAHTADWIARVRNGRLSALEQRRIGLPWSPELVERSRRSVGATIAACRAALADDVAAYLGGGTHHAAADRGAGYCVFNDAVVAGRTMQAEGLVRRVVVIDCDVHQGDGTARLVRDDPTVFAFSIHGMSGYPKFDEPGDLDIRLPNGTGDVIYLAELEDGLCDSLDRAGAELAIYLAGADPHEGDRIGRMKLTFEGLARRDELVLGACRARGIPVAVTIAGGYGRELDDVVRIHARTMQLAAGFSRRRRT